MPVFTSSIEVTADYPTIKPSLNLNFAKARALDPRVTLERASVGTYVGRDGLIKTAGVDEPRFDHDPVTLESLGLLIEESRTNIVHGNPGQANLVATSGQANSLTGNNDAYKLAKNSPSSNSQSHGSWGVTGNVSTTSYVMSIFVKKINHSKFFMQTVAQSADNLYVYIDIDTGVTSFTDYTASGNLTVTASIETYTDGWYRIISRVQGFAANTLASGFRFGFGDPSSGSQQYTNGDDEVLVYGAQIEDGSFATSYIPSADSSSSVTRAADYGYLTGENFSSWFNQTEGSLDVGYRLGYDNVGMRVCQISNQTSSTAIDLVVGSGGGVGGYWFIITGGVSQFSSAGVTNSSQVGADRNFRCVLAYKENDCAGQQDKITAGPTTDTSVTLATDYDRLLFYQIANSGDHIQGHLKYIRYYPKRITNAQVTQLSQDGI